MKQQGLTIAEVLVALSIVGVMIALFSTVFTSSLSVSRQTGSRDQAAQVMNYLGKRVIDAERDLLLFQGESLSWDYGELSQAFSDMKTGGGVNNPENYRAEVIAVGPVTVSGVSLMQYSIVICSEQQQREICVEGTAYSYEQHNGPNYTPPMPGVG